MSFAPIIPTSGLNGWQFLQRTMTQQATTHAGTATARREEVYFRENIGKIGSAEDLVNDRRLLRVALSAFGLADDLPNRAFIQRVLESPTREPAQGERRSFVHRLADRRYHDLAATFGFGDRITDANTASAKIAPQSDGAATESRLAASLQRDLSALAGSGIGDDVAWALVLNTPSLRAMFETAYDLPEAFAAAGFDEQLRTIRSRTETLFGSGVVAQFAEQGPLDALARRYVDRFAGDLLENFHARQFEEAVGIQDQSMRLAMALQRDLAHLARSDQSDSGQWFRILGTPSMRQVFETAFQLPPSFGSLDLDRQADILRNRTQRLFGQDDVAQFADPGKMDKLIRQFFIGQQLSDTRNTSTQSAALILLQSGQSSLAALRQR